jgi:hypothetical protein
MQACLELLHVRLCKAPRANSDAAPIMLVPPQGHNQAAAQLLGGNRKLLKYPHGSGQLSSMQTVRYEEACAYFALPLGSS